MCALLCMFLWSVLKVCTLRNDIYIPTHPRYCRFKKAYSKARKGTFIKCEYWAYSYKNFRHCYTQLKLHVPLKLVHQRKRLNFICLVQYIYIWVLIRFSILIIASIIYYLCLLLTFKHRFFFTFICNDINQECLLSLSSRRIHYICINDCVWCISLLPNVNIVIRFLQK